MTSVMSYGPLPGPAEMQGHTSGAEAASSPWLATSQLPYQDTYMTPAYSTYSTSDTARLSATSTNEDTPTSHPLSAGRSPWAESYTRPQGPEYLGSFTLPAPPLHVLPWNLHNRPLSGIGERCRSSPSTFGPTAHTIDWPDPREFRNNGSFLSSNYPEPPLLESNFTPTGPYQPGLGPELGSPSPPPPSLTILAPQPLRRYTPLAPIPENFSAKRTREEDETEYHSESGTPSTGGGKRRKRACSVASNELSEDDKLLVSLKEDEALPWKDIAARFGSHHGKTFQVAALQMRYKRLREKFRVWLPEDVTALKLSYEYWEKYKWDIISTKMLDHGVSERWPAKQCARKWQKCQDEMSTPTQQSMMLPQLNSPAQSPEFQYVPMQSQN